MTKPKCQIKSKAQILKILNNLAFRKVSLPVIPVQAGIQDRCFFHEPEFTQ